MPRISVAPKSVRSGRPMDGATGDASRPIAPLSNETASVDTARAFSLGRKKPSASLKICSARARPSFSRALLEQSEEVFHALRSFFRGGAETLKEGRAHAGRHHGVRRSAAARPDPPPWPGEGRPGAFRAAKRPRAVETGVDGDRVTEDVRPRVRAEPVELLGGHVARRAQRRPGPRQRAARGARVGPTPTRPSAGSRARTRRGRHRSRSRRRGGFLR